MRRLVRKRRNSLRVALVTTFYPPFNFGGDGQFVQRFAHALVKNGHEVEIIHDVDAYATLSKGPLPKLPDNEPEAIEVHRLQSSAPLLSSLATQQLGFPLVQRRRIEKILARGFDVIHYHNSSLVGGPGLLGIGDAIKLYTAHEHWLVCPMHILWKDNNRICEARSCFTCTLKHKRPPQLWRYTPLLKNAARHVDAFLALSEFSADKHKEFGFEYPMRISPSFLPDAPIAKRDASLNERPYFLLVGRLEHIKGFQDVIPAFDADGPADLLIAGDGAYENELRSLANGRPNVKFLGRKTPEELRSLYRNARALIASSRCYEVFPLVLLEAFQQETPVIARDLGPYPEIVRQAEGGLLFDDAQSLKQAIETLARDEAKRDKFGQNAKSAFDRLWSESVAIRAYESLIEELKQTPS